MLKNVHITQEEGILYVNYNVKRCHKCVLSENFPDINFDTEGLCNYCRIDEGWALSQQQHIQSLQDMHNLIQSRANRSYDCLVLYSGGKDSSYALYVVKNILGLNPLALTIDNGFMAQAVVPNMHAVLNNLNIDHITFRPSGRFMHQLYKSAIDETASDKKEIMYATSACGSCVSVILSAGAQECKNRNIPVMMGGWSPGQLTESPLLPGKFLEMICNSHFSKVALRSPHLKNAITHYHTETTDYPSLYNPLYGIRYDENEIYSSLTKIGWVKPHNTDSCSSNCRLNSFLVIDHIKKYGFHPYEYELAFHVRNDLTTREEALDKITHVSVSQSRLHDIVKEMQA